MEITNIEYWKIRLALLNLSQDIRFAARFQMKTHETLEKHLISTHENIDIINKILEKKNDKQLS